jgi:cytochrome c peroxidase
MRRKRLFAAALLGLATAVAGGTVALRTSARADAVAGPLPTVPTPPNIIPLEPIEQLGKDMLYDNTMSDPVGYACAQCHAPTTGFTTGLDSIVNLAGGPQPGVVPGRFGPRKPMSYAYAAFSPEGPYYDTMNQVWVGGNFWDGRAYDTSVQAQGPPINPDEMNNTPVGTAPNQYPPLLVMKLMNRPYTPLIQQIYGADVFTKYTPRQIFEIWGEAIAAFEQSGEICQFSSKYDASKYGTPPQNKYTLTASEERGRLLYFGAAQCSACHSSLGLPGVQIETTGKDTFTMYCYANIGVPKNPGNPFYAETDPISNPNGYNPLGAKFIDWGLGGNAVGSLDGTKFYNATPGDIPQFRGLFQTPTTRNSGTIPYPGFVKAYMHNGVFKSLEEVVHFYNKRNIATNAQGQEVAFDLRMGPPAGYTPLFPPPEVLDNVQNVAGYTPAQAMAAGTTGVTAYNGQVGNLGLTASQEADLVAFLDALSDGYTQPNPVGGVPTSGGGGGGKGPKGPNDPKSPKGPKGGK